MLVRDDFRGKRLVNAVIDLPFALPTIVAGLTLLALYGPRGASGINLAYTRAGVMLALLFVTLPFVVRAVQPVLLELDTDMEEAAASLGAAPIAIFRRIVFPNLLPAILSGVALAFARAVGEFGAVVLISGNLPFKTEMASVYIFGRLSRRTRRAPRRSRSSCSPSLSRSCSSWARIRRWATRHDRPGYASASASLAYLAAILLVACRAGLLADVRARLLAGMGRDDDAGGAARVLADARCSRAIAVPLNTVFGVLCALAIVRSASTARDC